MGSSLPDDHVSPLLSHVGAQTHDLDWTLAHYHYISNVTTLASECDIAHSPTMSVASCRTSPQLVLTFWGDSVELLATYAGFLTDPEKPVDLFVNAEQLRIVNQAFRVISVKVYLQLLNQGDSATLDPGPVSELADNDLSAVQALARSEYSQLQWFSPNKMSRGPAFGVWDRRRLVAMGTTIVEIPGAAQIGNVVVRKDFRNHGLAPAIIAALIKAHEAAHHRVFAVIDQDESERLELFESLGFVRKRAMYLTHCEWNNH